MDISKKHEIFEIEILNRLKSAKMLDPLVFGGGTMLRLCYELNRYSIDLDFWFIGKIPVRPYFEKFKRSLERDFDLTNAQMKFYTLLFEVRSPDYPRRLKIEIRKEIKDCDYQERIAFSKYSTVQVVLRTHTLEQTMKNKIEASLDRREIRDYFDMEFLLRRGIPIPDMNDRQLRELKKIAEDFTQKDFKVKLGSILESDIRRYYAENGFDYLKEKINEKIKGL